MELLLNLVWLGLAVACAIALLSHVPEEKQTHSLWFAITALICIVVLLFPVVSMTDDLHAEIYTIDDNAKRKLSVVDIQHHAVEYLTLRIAMLLVVSSRPSWSTLDEVLTPSPLEGVHTAVASRPPPALLLA